MFNYTYTNCQSLSNPIFLVEKAKNSTKNTGTFFSTEKPIGHFFGGPRLGPHLDVRSLDQWLGSADYNLYMRYVGVTAHLYTQYLINR